MENYIKLKDGSKILFQEITDMLPATVYLSKLHIQVCEIIAKKEAYCLTLTEQKVYVNLLCRKSSLLKQITGIIILTNNKIIDVEYVKSDVLDNELLNLFNEGIELIITPKKNINYIDKSQYKIFALKMILNNIFRIFQKIKKSDSIIRTWVDVTKDMYPDQFLESQLLIYPFTLNFKRQVKFVLELKKNHANWTFAGLPYSFSSVFRMFFLRKKDVLLAQAETQAYLIHGKEINSKNITKIFTSDEYEVASFVLYEYLIKNKIFTYNTAHGIGFSLPNICYSSFKIMNQAQKDFYIENGNSNINYQFGATRIKKITQDIQFEKFSPIIVLIHTNCEAVNLNFEAQLEEKLLKSLKNIALSLNIPFRVKLHPNTSIKTENQIKKEMKLKTFKNMEEIKKHNPIFINMFSTAYYDFSQMGPFLFLKEKMFDPSIYFGKHINTSDFLNLESSINKFKNEDIYKTSLKNQISTTSLEYE